METDYSFLRPCFKQTFIAFLLKFPVIAKRGQGKAVTSLIW
jgi:hypothetical protein